MSRLIDVDTFYRKLNDLSKVHQGVYNGAINDCMNLLDEQPTANIDKDVREEAYNKGLEDAWELAKKIVLETSKGGIPERDMRSMFGEKWTVSDIMRNFTPQEALAKLQAYEKEQESAKRKEDISELCEKIMDISSEHKMKYDEILAAVKEKLDFESFMVE